MLLPYSSGVAPENHFPFVANGAADVGAVAGSGACARHAAAPAAAPRVVTTGGKFPSTENTESLAHIDWLAFTVKPPEMWGESEREQLDHFWPLLNRLHLEGQHTKSGKRRFIPLNAGARQALLGRANFRAQYCPASPWVFAHKSGERVKYMQNGYQAACARAGIKDFRVHDLRHTFASWLVGEGVPLAEVRDLLGHSTIEMTERYAHLAPDNHVRAVSVLDRLSRSSHVDGAREGQRVS